MSATTTTTSTVTLRCTSTTGTEIASITINATSTFASTALKSVIGDHASGSMPAERFARTTFNALADYETQTDLRSHTVVKHLRALDRLALTAVGRGIPATITWA